MSRPTRVAVQGAPGCFSHAAALEFFDAVELVSCDDFPELFAAVEEGRADRGMVPVENALAGAVTENLDLLVRSPVHAVGETYVRVQMCLVAPPGRAIPELTAAGSHPVALRQCRGFFSQHPGIRSVVSHDTAGAIRDLMAGDAGFDAAIGPALAAEMYGGEVLERGIEDHPRNFTRFLVVAPQGVEAPRRSSKDKASLALTLPHRPGALHTAIGLFAEARLDLTRLESRPIPGLPWKYLFYLDVRTGSGDAFSRVLERLDEMASELHLLGRYPEAEAPGAED